MNLSERGRRWRSGRRPEARQHDMFVVASEIRRGATRGGQAVARARIRRVCALASSMRATGVGRAFLRGSTSGWWWGIWRVSVRSGALRLVFAARVSGLRAGGEPAGASTLEDAEAPRTQRRASGLRAARRLTRDVWRRTRIPFTILRRDDPRRNTRSGWSSLRGRRGSRRRRGKTWRSWTGSVRRGSNKDWVHPHDPEARITREGRQDALAQVRAGGRHGDRGGGVQTTGETPPRCR